MIKKYGINNYNTLVNKLKKIDNLDFNEVLLNLKTNIICVGSGASYTTAYLASKILNRYFNKNSYAITPRDLLNVKVGHNTSIIAYSYSGTSEDIKYIKDAYKNVIIVTGRNLSEFDSSKNIFSYYLNENYERGLILYENIIIPITLLLNNIDSFKDLIKYQIKNFNNYKVQNLKSVRKIAIFCGDYTTAAAYDLTDKLLETGIISFDLFDKKSFSHGQYNYFMNNKYDKIIYFKQKNVSKYENELLSILKSNNLIIIESDYNGLYAAYDLLFKEFVLFNELVKNKNMKLYDSKFQRLFKFKGDFS